MYIVIQKKKRKIYYDGHKIFLDSFSWDMLSKHEKKAKILKGYYYISRRLTTKAIRFF